MKVAIHRSGGIGGVRLGGTINFDELPRELAARAAEALSRDRLAAAAQEEAAPGAADIPSYEVTLLDEGVTYTVIGSPRAGETVAVLDELVAVIVRRRRTRGDR